MSPFLAAATRASWLLTHFSSCSVRGTGVMLAGCWANAEAEKAARSAVRVVFCMIDSVFMVWDFLLVGPASCLPRRARL